MLKYSIETQGDIILEHYSSDAVELLKELYRTKNHDEINEQDLCRDHSNIMDYLIENHKSMKDKHFKVEEN